MVLGQPTIGPIHVTWTLERRVDVRRRRFVAHPIFTVLASRPLTELSTVTISCLHLSLMTFRVRLDSGTHSAFSNPEMFTTSSFRGFTHHSTYAGYLIFNNRSHHFQQYFEYGVGETGLGLSGIHASNSHSLQVPIGHLQDVDDIGLNAITLQDSSIDLGYDVNSKGGVMKVIRLTTYLDPDTCPRTRLIPWTPSPLPLPPGCHNIPLHLPNQSCRPGQHG